ncbi:MAG: HU family DNA-binding protein [Gammaproteobacteria bacterium]|nr:HU family DNA-binding protein [Gammaproteobacteria bacterium]
MNKSDLINHVRNATGLKKEEASAALNAVLGGISSALNEADTVALAGFGNFSVKDRPAYTGRHPQTGAAIQVPSRKVVLFKPGKALKESVN